MLPDRSRVAYEEIRIGTEADGSFVVTSVPAPVKWYV
jgi:hypothetical protein